MFSECVGAASSFQLLHAGEAVVPLALATTLARVHTTIRHDIVAHFAQSLRITDARLAPHRITVATSSRAMDALQIIMTRVGVARMILMQRKGSTSYLQISQAQKDAILHLASQHQAALSALDPEQRARMVTLVTSAEWLPDHMDEILEALGLPRIRRKSPHAGRCRSSGRTSCTTLLQQSGMPLRMRRRS